MYESIRGTLLRRDPATAIVDVGGLAYRLQVPLSTYEALPKAGADVNLLVHLSVREDEWRLFGFGTEAERDGFRALIRVVGVGPVLALSILSGFAPNDLRRAVAGADMAALTRVKGVGRKTAERIVVELRDAWGSGPIPAAEATPSGPMDEAALALESLGQSPEEARKRAAKAYASLGSNPHIPIADLVRAALRS